MTFLSDLLLLSLSRCAQELKHVIYYSGRSMVRSFQYAHQSILGQDNEPQVAADVSRVSVLDRKYLHECKCKCFECSSRVEKHSIGTSQFILWFQIMQ